jgi:hippurate hydrolase
LKNILEEAKRLQPVLVEHRRYLHEHAEIEFDLPVTVEYVTDKLKELGYEPQPIGCSGITVTVGKQSGKTILLRADMDALPIEEQTELSFKACNGNMHACGHDLHTSMLLGAAKLLKEHEDELKGCVKLIFQPNEEALGGAKNMIESGLLENPKVDVAMMIHVQTGLPFPIPAGALLTMPAGPALASADWFTITVQGKGGHGGNPQFAVDPINVACHIHLALQTINSRETPALDPAVITVGSLHGGDTNNVIPDTAVMKGTIRAFGKENRAYIKKRLEEISKGIAETFRATAEVEYTTECPCLFIDGKLEGQIEQYSRELFGNEAVINLGSIAGGAYAKNTGSEDFAFVSDKVPTAAVFIAAGSIPMGYPYGNHHPKVLFDENALCVGTAVYVNSAIEWLADNA